jgi:hypothetical protein
MEDESYRTFESSSTKQSSKRLNQQMMQRQIFLENEKIHRQQEEAQVAVFSKDLAYFSLAMGMQNYV